jgi:hypothetical protein
MQYAKQDGEASSGWDENRRYSSMAMSSGSNTAISAILLGCPMFLIAHCALLWQVGPHRKKYKQSTVWQTCSKAEENALSGGSQFREKT